MHRENAPSVGPSDVADVCASAREPGGPVLAWGGDINLGRRQHYRTAQLGMARTLCVPALKRAALTIANLECVVATQGEQGTNKDEGAPYYYRARPEMLGVLTSAGIDVVITANNHAGDYGPEALLEQTQWLASVGIAQAGSGANEDDAFAPVYREAGELTVAVFALDTTQRRFAARGAAPGTAYLAPTDPAVILQHYTARIEHARQRAHVVLVALHAGPNEVEQPGEAERALTHALIDAGFDAVLGASAHRLQGLEVYRGRPIVHDAGDLLFDAVRTQPVTGGVFELALSAHGVERVTLVPVGVGFGQTEPLVGEAASAALARFAAQCQQLGSPVVVQANGTASLDLAPPSRSAPPAGRPVAPLRYPPAPPALPATFGRVDAVPEDARMPPIPLGPLTLLGVHLTPSTLGRRSMLWVESYWTTQAPLERDHRLDFQARLIDERGAMPWGRAMDHDPCDWMMPTSRWTPGVIYRDRYGLRPPAAKALFNGTLQLHVGVIDPDSTAQVQRTPLPLFVTLAIPGRDRAPAAPSDAATPAYRMSFAPQALTHTPGTTWTADALAAATGGRWLTLPAPDWHVRSAVAFPNQLGMLPGPLLFVASEARHRTAHEQSTQPRLPIDRHANVAKYQSRLAGAMVSRRLDDVPADFPQLLVEDPIKAFIEMGIAARRRYAGPVVAITGTVGKSTSVDMLTALLGGRDHVLASIDNFNSRVGAIATLASLSPDHLAAVVEIAQSALWMRRGPVTRLIQPTIALITEISWSQTNRRVRSINDVLRWKTRVFDGLCGPAVAIVGEHLPHFEQVLGRAREHAREVLMFGTSAACTVRYAILAHEQTGTQIRVVTPRETLTFRLPVPGEGAVRSAVAACAVLYAMGLALAPRIERLARFQTAGGRMQLFVARIGTAQVQVIDDSFNAEVASMLNAFEVLGRARPPRHKIAVLGRIVHLGEMAEALHRSLGEPLLQSGVDHVVTHGPEMLALRAVLPKALLGPHFSSAAPLVAHVLDTVGDGDCVLIKGSRRDSDFERVAQALHAYDADQAGAAPS